MGKPLEGKTAVVTGGNSGIGLATAREFTEQGAKVLITGRNKEALEKAAREIGAAGLVSDQARLESINDLVAEAKKRFGQLDILFLNAGVANLALIEEITEVQFDANMGINFKGAFFTLQKSLPLLKQGSSVTFLSSVNAYTGAPKTAVYAASKAATNSLMRTASYELAPRGIRVNAVCPGPISTAFVNKAGIAEDATEGFNAAMRRRIPMKRLGTPEDVAKLVAFLSSDNASFITGAEYLIDGGVLVNPILG